MQALSQADDIGDASMQAVGNKVNVAGNLEGGSEIVFAGRGAVLDFMVCPEKNTPFAWPLRVWLNAILGQGVEAGFKGSQADDGFENRTGKVAALSRAIGFRTQGGIITALALAGWEALDGMIRIIGRYGGHCPD